MQFRKTLHKIFQESGNILILPAKQTTFANPLQLASLYDAQPRYSPRRQFPRCTHHRGVLYRHNLLCKSIFRIYINLTGLRANGTGGWITHERSRRLIALKSADPLREFANNLIRRARFTCPNDNPVLCLRPQTNRISGAIRNVCPRWRRHRDRTSKSAFDMQTRARRRELNDSYFEICEASNSHDKLPQYQLNAKCFGENCCAVKRALLLISFSDLNTKMRYILQTGK